MDIENLKLELEKLKKDYYIKSSNEQIQSNEILVYETIFKFIDEINSDYHNYDIIKEINLRLDTLIKVSISSIYINESEILKGINEINKLIDKYYYE